MTTEATTRYRSIARRLEESIQSGVYEPGERLPSLRQLTRSFSASMNTVRRAVALLEDQGIVEPKRRSGYYVLRSPRAVRDSSYVDDLVGSLITCSSRAPEAGQRRVVLDKAVLPDSLIPRERLAASLRRVATSADPLVRDYAVFERTEGVRTQIARRALDSGIVVDPEEIVLADGILNAMLFLLATLNRERKPVILESPVYYPLLPILETLGMPHIELPVAAGTDRYLDTLDCAINGAGAAVAVLSPAVHNPTGTSRAPELIAEIAKRSRPGGLRIIEHDILRETLGVPSGQPTIYGLAEPGSVVLLSSFEEVIAPSLKASWFAAGPDSARLRDELRAVNCTVAGMQLAVLEELLASGFYKQHRERLVSTMRDRFTSSIADIKRWFPQGTTVEPPTGGYSLWIQLPHTLSSRELFRAAREQGIAVAPGNIFSRGSGLDRFLRLCPGEYGAAEVEAVATLGELLAGRR